MRKVRREVTRKLILAAVIGEPNAVSNAIGYAMYSNRAHDAVIRVYNDADSTVGSRRSSID